MPAALGVLAVTLIVGIWALTGSGAKKEPSKKHGPQVSGEGGL